MTTFYVDPANPSNVGTGTPLDPYSDLQLAFDQCCTDAGDE